jgi:transcriptional regulator with XRE-family HTH domain
MVGMTQQQLAEKVGIKFQQIQKYETGMNRVSASRLWDISEALSVPVSYFFEGMDRAEDAETAAKPPPPPGRHPVRQGSAGA